MSAAFDGGDWGSNGPLLVSRVLMRICHVGSVEDLRPEKCLGVATLPTANFYPVPWRSWKRLFEPKLTEEVLKEVEVEMVEELLVLVGVELELVEELLVLVEIGRG